MNRQQAKQFSLIMGPLLFIVALVLALDHFVSADIKAEAKAQAAKLEEISELESRIDYLKKEELPKAQLDLEEAKRRLDSAKPEDRSSYDSHVRAADGYLNALMNEIGSLETARRVLEYR